MVIIIKPETKVQTERQISEMLAANPKLVENKKAVSRWYNRS